MSSPCNDSPGARGATIYFIQCNGADGPIKIGQAKFIDKRLSELQIGCPYDLSLIGHAWFDDADMTERRLHDQFAEHWIRGEWFRCCDAIMAKVREFRAIQYAVSAEVLRRITPAKIDPPSPHPPQPPADRIPKPSDDLAEFRAHRTMMRGSAIDPARRRRR